MSETTATKGNIIINIYIRHEPSEKDGIINGSAEGSIARSSESRPCAQASAMPGPGNGGRGKGKLPPPSCSFSYYVDDERIYADDDPEEIA